MGSAFGVFENGELIEEFKFNPGDTRAFAREVNRRMGKGNNFMASKSMNSNGAPEDYALLNNTNFHHCRIGYKMDEICGGAPNYTIPASHLTKLQNMVDWCLAEGLIPVIDPVHNWANGPGFTNPADLPKLGKIWVQVATHFADYDLDNVVFEIMNEPCALKAVTIQAQRFKRLPDRYSRPRVA